MPLKDDSSKGLVREIFEKPSSKKKRLSALYTHKPLKQGRSLEQDSVEEFPPGIELGSGVVRLVQLSRNRDAGVIEVRRVDSVYSASIADAVKLLVKRNRLRGEAVISIPDNFIRIYNLNFPPMPEEELDNVIAAKIDQLKPMHLKDKEIHSGYLKTPYHTLVISVSQEKLNEVKSIFKKAGIKPAAIEFSLTSLIRLEKFGLAAAPHKGVHLWLNFGEAITLALSRDGEIIFATILSILPQAIEQALASEGTGSFQILEKLAVEIEHSFKSLAGDISAYDSVFLTGKTTNPEKLESFLNEKLGKPLVKIDPFKLFNISSSLPDEARGFIKGDGEFSLAASLAARNLDVISRRFDLLSFKIKKKGASPVLFKERFVWQTIAFTLILFLAVSFQLLNTYFRGNNKIARLNAAAGQIQKDLTHQHNIELSVSEDENALAGKKMALEEKAEILKKSLRAPETFSPLLVTIASLLPETVRVTKLSFKDNRFIVSGRSEKIDTVINFVSRLNVSKNFARATFNYSEKKTDEGPSVFDFEVTIEPD